MNASLRISSIDKENSDFINVGDVGGRIVVVTRTYEGLTKRLILSILINTK